MVYLNRIYTRSGDAGETSLGDGTRVPKTHPRIAAYGTVDELNAALGMALTADGFSDGQQGRLQQVQNDLFDVGADLCVPQSEGAAGGGLRVKPAQIERLETWIDEDTARLQPLTSFILPGGSPASAALHFARTVCRRSEIAVEHLAAEEAVNPQVRIYLNRLSDLLFVMARRSNDDGRGDVLWVPGAGQS